VLLHASIVVSMVPLLCGVQSPVEFQECDMSSYPCASYGPKETGLFYESYILLEVDMMAAVQCSWAVTALEMPYGHAWLAVCVLYKQVRLHEDGAGVCKECDMSVAAVFVICAACRGVCFQQCPCAACTVDKGMSGHMLLLQPTQPQGQLYSTCQNGALQWMETALRACPALLAGVGCGRLLSCYAC
jgi:hypothetical protein